MKCRVCEGQNIKCVWEMLGHTPSKQLFKQKQEQYCQWDMRLNACEQCGFLQISEPLSAKVLYANYLFPTSWKLHPHAKSLLARLCELAPSGSKICELGCNDGAFLYELQSALASEVAVGIEPSKDVYTLAKDRGLNVINDFFNLSLADSLCSQYGSFDVIYSRHVFEHIEDLASFLEGIKKLCHKQSVVMIEVPNCQNAIESGDISIFWEEHLSYFTPAHLIYTLEKYGFSIMESREYEFSGESLVCFARVRESGDSKNIESMDFTSHFAPYTQAALGFSHIATKRLDSLLSIMHSMIDFINLYAKKYVDYVIDDERQKQGYILPDCGKEIIGFDMLSQVEAKSVGLVLLGTYKENEENILGKCRNVLPKDVMYIPLYTPSSLQSISNLHKGANNE